MSQGNKPIRLLLFVFGMSVLMLLVLFYHMPKFSEEEKELIKLPRDIEDAKGLGRVLSGYKESHYFVVLLGYLLTYIFLQTFAIPGSIGLSILSGYLYPFPIAIILVCSCSAIGATNCYLLAGYAGDQLIRLFRLQSRVNLWREKMLHHKHHLIYYIIFLRITPILPNWFINITAPQLDVPLFPYVVGTFLGVAPPSFLFIRAGTTLYAMVSTGDAISPTSIILTALLAIVSLMPVAYSKWVERSHPDRVQNYT